MSRDKAITFSTVITVRLDPCIRPEVAHQIIRQRCEVAALTLHEEIDEALARRAARKGVPPEVKEGGGDDGNARGPGSL